MIMMGSNKKKIAQVLADRFDSYESPNERAFKEMAGEPSLSEKEDLNFVAGQLLKAIAVKDTLEFKKNLELFFQLCESKPHQEYGEEPNEMEG